MSVTNSSQAVSYNTGPQMLSLGGKIRALPMDALWRVSP